MCGEKHGVPVSLRCSAGSPPHVRGKALCRSRLLPIRRITPACAGKSACAASARGGRKDHPRMCGEKDPDRDPGSQLQGSPPRMRGKVAGAARRDFLTGITPAYAGKSCAGIELKTGAEDHPRVCGEKLLAMNSRAIFWGSPPRMRGKGYVGGMISGALGITPAYAGKSLFASACRAAAGDHPRVCGEKILLFHILAHNIWITPAYAGKSRQRGRGGRRRQDHPRVCGEKFHPGVVTNSIKWITPAYAGKRPKGRAALT